MLSARELTLAYESRPLLASASIGLEPGSIIGLIAPNGHGKTTLLRALAGSAVAVQGGRITADGVSTNEAAAYRRLVFYAPGDASLLYPSLSVREHLSMVRTLWGSRGARAVGGEGFVPGITDESASSICRELGVAAFERKRVRALSQGMKQQVAIALALLTGARYLLLDEPMNALDPSHAECVARMIRERAQAGCSILLSSHILGSLDGLVNQAMFIVDGKLEVAGAHVAGGFAAAYRERYGAR